MLIVMNSQVESLTDWDCRLTLRALELVDCIDGSVLGGNDGIVTVAMVVVGVWDRRCF